MGCHSAFRKSWVFTSGESGGEKSVTVPYLETEEQAQARARAELLRGSGVRKSIEFETWRTDIEVGDNISVIGELYIVTAVRVSITAKKTISKIKGVRFG